MQGGTGSLLHRENFKNMVQFGVFWCLFLSDCVLKYSLYKNFKKRKKNLVPCTLIMR